MPGSYVYAMAADGGVGSLMRVVSDEDDEVLVEYLKLDQTKAGRKASQGPVFILERTGGGAAWLADPAELWTVDHLVKKLMSSASGRVSRVQFDYHEANAEIARRGGSWQAPRVGWAEAETPAGSRGGAEAGSAIRSPDYDLDGTGTGAYSPFSSEGIESRLAEVELAEAVDSVQEDAERRHTVNRGPEGRVAARVMEVRGGAPEGQGGPVQQPCPYIGMTCGGCNGAFELGEAPLEQAGHWALLWTEPH